ncbi:MAG: hypothetical protein HY674_16175 [Chloroflexi bacterium]|nr:hypothetical protein [Chloroflexota bacterium]
MSRNLKEPGVLMRFNKLRETLQLRLSGEFKRFADEELRAVLTLLAGPGMIQRLDFGGFILLRPEVLSRYAAAVVRRVRKHPQNLFSTSQPSPALRAPSPKPTPAALIRPADTFSHPMGEGHPVGEGQAASARMNCWPGIWIARISNVCRARMRRWCCAGIAHPGGAKDNSPAIYRWVSGRRGNESRQGRKR